MDIQEVLEKAVYAFRITATNGAEFWAPYLRNDNYSEDPNVPRGLGKASAFEIEEAANYVVSLFPMSTDEEIRRKLVDGSLPEKKYNYKGVDCSGFIYYVMDRVYHEVLGKELMDDLSVPKNHVVNGAFNLLEWKGAYELSEDQAVTLPHDVPMPWVVETFKRKPVNLCRVAGLLSDYSSVEIPLSDLRVGDMVDIKNKRDSIPHLALVLEIKDASVCLVHSGRKNPSETGGITIEELAYDNEKIHTEDMIVPRDYHSIRRLKSLC